jgi:hypothetical protein
MANLTGGVMAPQIAAPKIAGVRPQRVSAGRTSRVPGRTGGTPVLPHPAPQHASAPQHTAQRQQVRQAASRAQGHPAPQRGFNPLEGTLNSQQINKIAGQQVRANAAPVLKGLEGENREIQGAEGVAQQRLAGMGATGQQQLAGLQAGQEASAKTGENNVAEAAANATKQINASGQLAQSATAGFVDPQVQQALAAAGNTAAGQAGAAQGYQAATATSGANLLTGLRGAAVQRVSEGAGRLSQAYGAGIQKNTQKEAEIRAGEPGETSKTASDLIGKQVSDVLAAKQLGVKQFTAKTTAANDQAKNALTERGQNAANARNRENNQQRESAAKLGLPQKKADVEQKQADTNLKKYQLEHGGSSGAKGLTTSETDSYIKSLTGSFNLVQQYRAGITPKTESAAQRKAAYDGIRRVLETGEHPEKYKTRVWDSFNEKFRNEEKTRIVQGGKTATPIATAAVELYNTHAVSPGTREALKALGVELPPDKQLYAMAGGR